MARAAACLTLLSLLLLAGCAAPPTATTAHSTATGTPFRLDREGDLLNGTSGAWRWHVAPGFTAFRVHLFFTELPGTGVAAAALTGVKYHLTGDDGAGRHADAGDDNGFSAGVGDGCALCTDTGFPGDWTFTLAAMPSAAHYRLHIETDY